MSRIDQLKNFLNESPDDCFLKHALALEYIKIGMEDEAQILFEENKSFDPQYIGTYYHLGQLLERKGLSRQAGLVFREGMDRAMFVSDQHAFNELRAAFENLDEEYN